MTLPPFVGRLLAERIDARPGWVIFLELFLGFGWLRAATEKIISREWWQGDPILRFAAVHVDETLPWYRPIIEHVIAPAVVAVAIATVVLQLTIGVNLLVGRRTEIGLLLGTLLNINIVVGGATSPSIFYMMMQGALALWLVERLRSGPTQDKLLRGVIVLGVLMVVSSVPFVRTLHPADVIEDPAAVLATFGVCALVAALVVRSASGEPSAAEHSGPAPDPSPARDVAR